MNITVEGESLNLTFEEADYTHTLVAIGGPRQATFTLRNRRPYYLSALFNRLIGRKVKAYVNGIPVFTGYIARMDYTTNGVIFRRSIEYSQTINAVRVYYSNDIGERKSTSWLVDNVSIQRYGRLSYVASLGGATDEQAQRYALQMLAEKSKPVARLIGAGGGQPKIVFTAIGDWGRAGLLYRERTEHAAASTLIAKLASEVGYRVKRIANNPMVVKADCTYPQRYNDLFSSIVEQGDDDLNRYRLEVIDGAILYEPVSLTYNWDNGIVRLGDAPIHPAMVKAGAFVQSAGHGVNGGAFISQITYSVKSGLQLSLLELTGRASMLSSQIQH